MIVKNITTLILGAAGAQLIMLLAMPIITRLYNPSMLGVAGSYIAIVSILLPIATMSLYYGIVTSKSKSLSLRVTKASVQVIVIICFIVLLISVISSLFYRNFSFIFIPCLLIFSCFVELFGMWLIKDGLYGKKSRILFYISLVSNGLKVIVGLFSPTLESLLGITLISYIIHSYLMYRLSGWKAKSFATLFNRASFKFNFLYILRRFQDFAIYRTPQNLLVSLNQSLPVLYLTYFFSAEQAGYFVLCRSALNAPVTLISKSINDVLYPEINRIYLDGKNIFNLIFRWTLILFLLGTFPVIILIIYGDVIFSFIFGSEWVRAGEFASWLAIYLLFNFINRPAVASVPVLGVEKFLLLNSIFGLLLTVVTFLILWYFQFSSDSLISAYSVVSILPQILLISYVLKKSKG